MLQWSALSAYAVMFTSWVYTIGIALGAAVGLYLVKGVIARRWADRSSRPQSDPASLAVELFRRTGFWFFLALSVYLSLPLLHLPAETVRVAGKIVAVLVFLQVGLWGNAVVSFVVAKSLSARLGKDDTAVATVYALGFVGRLLLWLVLLVLALDNLGVEITTLVAGLGIGGIAVALALQNVLGDLFGSLSILLDKPFVIGDFIIIDNYMGTVEHIGLKSTRIRSLSGEQLVFSNSDLLKSRIRNYKRMFERRVVFSVGVAYETPYEKLKRLPALFREIIESCPQVRFDRAHFKEYGPFSLNFEIVYYVLDPDYNFYMDTQQAINLAIFRRFKEEGIEFAFPTQTLYVHPAPKAIVAELRQDLQGE
ncbi:MAG: mechanosensitive ion channel family protein [Moorellales bacterium]